MFADSRQNEFNQTRPLCNLPIMKSYNSEKVNHGLAQLSALYSGALAGDKASIAALSRKFAGGNKPLVTEFVRFWSRTSHVRQLKNKQARKLVVDELLTVFMTHFSKSFSTKNSLDFNENYVRKMCKCFHGFLQTGYSLRLFTKHINFSYCFERVTKSRVEDDKVINYTEIEMKRRAKKSDNDACFIFGDIKVTISHSLPQFISRFDIFFALCNKFGTSPSVIDAHVFNFLSQSATQISDAIDGIGRVGKDIEQAGNQIASVDETLKSAIRTVSVLATLALTKGEEFKTSFEQLQRELVSACTFVVGPCKDILMSLIFAMMHCFTSPEKWASHLLIAVSEMAMKYCVGQAIEKCMRSIVQKISEQMVSHSGDLMQTTWMAVRGVLSIASCGMILSSGNAQDSILTHLTKLDTFVDTINRKYQRITHLEKVFEWLKSYSDSIFKYVYKLLTGEEYRIEIDAKFGEVHDWICRTNLLLQRDVREFMDLDDEEPVGMTDLSPQQKDLYDNKIEHLYLAGQSHLIALQRARDGSLDSVIGLVKSQLTMLQNKCKDVQQKYFNKTKGFRKEPLSVVLCGPPGHGKSTLLNILYSTYFMSCGFTSEKELKYMMKNEIYADGGNEYVNGYHGQKIYLFDDACQQQTQEGNPDEMYEKFIHYKNAAPCNVNMASIEDKNMHFTSDLIILTTNSTLKDKYSLKDSNAFDRRVDFKLLVLMDEEVLSFPETKRHFDYNQELGVIAKAFRTQQNQACGFSMGVVDPVKLIKKYGDKTHNAYRFVLLDQCSESGLEPLSQISINGEKIPLNRYLTLVEFEALFCKKQKELSMRKDATEKLVASYTDEARDRIKNLMSHTVADSRNYCWKGTWCVDSKCLKMHPLGIRTLGQALSIKFDIGAFVDPVTLSVRTCIDGSCDSTIDPHRCIDHVDIQTCCYQQLDLIDNVSNAQLNEPVNTYLDLVQNHSREDMTISEVDPLIKAETMTNGDFIEKHGGFTGIVGRMREDIRSVIGPIFEQARAKYHQTWNKKLSDFKESLFGKHYWTVIGLFSGALTVFAGAYYYFSKPKGEETIGHVRTAAFKERQKAKKAEMHRMVREGIFFEPSNEHPPQWVASSAECKLVSELNKASYAVFKTKRGTLSDGTNGRHVLFGNVTCMKGQLFVTAKHVITYMQEYFAQDESNMIILKNQIRHVGIGLVASDLTYYTPKCNHWHIKRTTKDLGFFAVDPEVMVPGRDLTKYTLDKNEKTSNFSICISKSYKLRDDMNVSPYNYVSMIHSSQARDDIILNFSGENSAVCEAYTTSHSMSAGQSGSSICLVNGGEKPRFFGVYNGGNQEIGVVTKFTKQDIDEAEFHLGQQVQFNCLDIKPGVASEFYTGAGGEVTFEGTIPKAVIGAKNTAIVPSGLYNKMHEVSKKPAHLTTFKNADGDKINPRRNAERKYFTPNTFIDRYEAEVAVEGAVAFSASSYNKTRDRVLTTEEAILGVLTEEYINAIESSSSSGHLGREKFLALPHEQLMAIKRRIAEEDGVDIEAVKINNRCFKTLCKFMTESDLKAFDSDKTKWVDIYEEYEKDALAKFARKERLNHLWEDQLKDETRPFAKVDIGKTRMFNCSADVCYLILMRKYTAGFAATTMEGRVDNGFGVGINCYNEDWDKLYNTVVKFGPNQVFAGDFGAFDSSHNYILNSRMMRLINKYFYPLATPEENNVREMLWLEIINSVHVNENDILTWVKGMPSGNPLTTLINCIVNNTAMRLCWNRAMKNAGLDEYANSESFNEFVVHISYGDDSLTAVHEQFSNVFNQEIVGALMPIFGFEYTDEMKQDASQMVPFRNIDELNFLKRKFRKCPRTGYITAPIDTETIFGMTDYVRDKNNVPQQTIVNAKNALREASLHDQDFFESFYLKLRNELDEVYCGIGATLNGNYWDQREIIRASEYKPY